MLSVQEFLLNVECYLITVLHPLKFIFYFPKLLFVGAVRSVIGGRLPIPLSQNIVEHPKTDRFIGWFVAPRIVVDAVLLESLSGFLDRPRRLLHLNRTV